MLTMRSTRPAAEFARAAQGRRADTRVVVAMSGGVDTRSWRRCWRTQGYDVVGVTLQLYDHGAALAKARAPAAPGATSTMRARVAETIGIPALRARLRVAVPRRSVIDDFADAYLGGRDAGALHPLQRAGEVPRPAGDRARPRRRLHGDGTLCAARRRARAGPELHRAADPARDQSYFLFSTTREQLAFLRFPLGGLASKAETRALAARYGLAVADKPDSQDICFVPNGDYAAVIEKLRPGRGRAGRDRASRRAGARRHDGRDPLHGRPAPGAGHRRRTSRSTWCAWTPSARRVIVGPRAALATRDGAGRRGQLAGRWRLRGGARRGLGGRGQGALDPAAGRRAPSAGPTARGSSWSGPRRAWRRGRPASSTRPAAAACWAAAGSCGDARPGGNALSTNRTKCERVNPELTAAICAVAKPSSSTNAVSSQPPARQDALFICISPKYMYNYAACLRCEKYKYFRARTAIGQKVRCRSRAKIATPVELLAITRFRQVACREAISHS